MTETNGKSGYDTPFPNLDKISVLKRSKILEDKDLIIDNQALEIRQLKIQLESTKFERDSLLCQINKLQFYHEMDELKRLHFKSTPQRCCIETNSSNLINTADSADIRCSPIGYLNDVNLGFNNHSVMVNPSVMAWTNGVGKSPPYKTGRNPHTSNSNGSIHNGGGVNCTTDDLPLVKKTPPNRKPIEYEFNYFFEDKRVEMLEKVYGGSIRARAAALIIQRAFRKYQMVKKFEAMTKATDKRMSRRLVSAIVSSTSQDKYSCWSDSSLSSSSFAKSRSFTDSSLSARLNYSAMSGDASNNNQCCACCNSNSSLEWTQDGAQMYFDGQGQPLNNNEFDEPVQGAPSHGCGSAGAYYRGGYCAGSNPAMHVEGAVVSGVGSVAALVSPPASNACRQQRFFEPNAVFGDYNKRLKPEVPKRTSSISSRSTDSNRRSDEIYSDTNSQEGDIHQTDIISLRSESTGSQSSLLHHQDSSPAIMDGNLHRNSPLADESIIAGKVECRVRQNRRMSESASSGVSSDSALVGGGHVNNFVRQPSRLSQHSSSSVNSEQSRLLSEVIRKRHYRVGLNLFNKKPDKGIDYLLARGFVDNTPQAVARFLISRKGLSKQMIGEYLGNLQNHFNMAALECFSAEIDLSGMQVDVALRKFQSHFRMPGEAQKIERLMEVFGQRYCQCNRDIMAKFHSPDTIFIMAFAIIMLNTDLHTPSLKADRRMKLADFVKNLRNIDDGQNLDGDMLCGIYERVKRSEFRPSSDHVTQVLKVQQTIVGKKPSLALPHRRLVCYCRLYEVPDVNKKERSGLHQREVFLFNDILVVTKIFSKKKNSVTYTFRQSYTLSGLHVQLFQSPNYLYGIHLVQKVDQKILATFNARNEHDRSKFVEDLRESIYEMDEMESLRIESELERQKVMRKVSENRDSGVVDLELCNNNSGSNNKEYNSGTLKAHTQREHCVEAELEADGGDVTPTAHQSLASTLKRSALSNSLLDINEQKKPQRRGSAGSLDSGMSVSFQSSSASTVSRDSSPPQLNPHHKHHSGQQHHKQPHLATVNKNINSCSAVADSGSTDPAFNSQLATAPPSGFIGGLFNKKGRSNAKGNMKSMGSLDSQRK